MRTEHAPAIHRADYAPLPWTVLRVDLHFSLHPEATVVTSRLACVRNRAVDAGALVLDGDELETLARNESVGLGADTIQPKGQPVDGEQRWLAYSCGTAAARPAARRQEAGQAETFPIED